MNSTSVLAMADDVSAEVGGAKLSFPVEYKDKETNPNIEIKGYVNVGYKLKFNFYKKFKYVNFSVKLSQPTEVGVSAKVEGSPLPNNGIPLGTILIPTGVAGCTLKLQPKFVVNLEAKLEVKFTIEPSLKISYDSDTDKAPKFTSTYGDEAEEFTFELEGKAFVGIEFESTLMVLHENLASLSVSAKAGVEIKGTLKSKLTGDGEFSTNIMIATDTSGDTAHACNNCVDGDISFVIEGGAKLKLALIGELKATLVKVTVPLGDWYYSSDIGFGWGTCPNIAYKVAFNLTDSNGNSIPGAKIYVDAVELTTGSGGGTFCYCKEGTYGYQVSYGNYSDYYGDFTIYNKAKTINLQINTDGAIEVKSTKDTTVTVPTPTTRDSIPVPEDEPDPVVQKIAVVESGQLGDDIYYMIYADGFMFVYGSGEMDDYGWGHYYENADLVTEVSVENTDGTKGITKIGAYTMVGLKNMTKIELPDTITSIGDNAFEGCSSIRTIAIPSKVMSIGNSAFSGCSNLTGVSIPSAVKTIGDYAFNECTGFTTLTIPGTVETIGSFAFANCTGLKSAIIEDGVGYINSWIFDNCTSLESLTLPYAGHSLSDVAENNADWFSSFLNHDETNSTYMAAWWYANRSLKSVTITGGTTIPSSFFEGMQGLTSITLPDSIITIHGYAFNGCSSLSSITIPNSVTTIGDYAFGSCTKLTGISIPSSVTSLGTNVFDECKSFTNITIPGTVKNIGSGLFSNCTALKEVVISDGVENIDDHIFDNCTSLQKITLPYPSNALL